MRKVVSLRLPDTTIAAARRRAKRQNRTLTNYIESVLQHDLDRRETGAERNTPEKPVISSVLKTLRAHRADLERMGVVHAAIFGSVARGEAASNSDVDILVEIDPAAVDTLFGYAEIQQAIEEWIGRPIDVARKDRLRPGVAAEAERDQIVAF
jgi:hypothetical protein